jgi:conjugal transfer mating pair stabilization protein TraN
MRILKILSVLIILNVCTLVLADGMGMNEAFNKREQYKNETTLGDPDEVYGSSDNKNREFLKKSKDTDVSAFEQLNDSSLIDQGQDALRNSKFGQFLQDSDEKKIEAMNKYKIDSENPMLKKSLKIENDPLSETGGKNLSVSETTTSTEVKKSCTEGVDFNVDVGLELVLEAEEVEDSVKNDTTILISGVEILNRFGHWGRYIDKRYGVRLWVLYPSSPEKEKQARELIAEKLGVPVAEIGEKIIFPADGCGPSGWHAEDQVSINVYEDTFVWPVYQFGYERIEKKKRFVEKREYWQIATEGAEKLAESNECYETGRVCTKSGAKTFFGKYDVSRPCWYERISYRCTSEPKDGCAHLFRQNCRLVDSECKYRIGPICLRWKRDFICGGIKKEQHYSLKDSPIYCLGGDCHTPTLEENQDFANVAYLAALNEANKDCVKGSNGICKNPITVFAGEAVGCKKIIAGVINCCSSMKGWGRDLNLSRCSPGEKGLALKREKKLCHLVGTYCHEKDPVFGKCLVKKTNFCCFGSKLARIFQEQARAQLPIGWGDEKSPNCRPLTIKELASLDFSKFDMEELFDALLSKGKSNMHKSFPNLPREGEIPAIQKEHMQTSSTEKREIRRRTEDERRAKEQRKAQAKQRIEQIRQKVDAKKQELAIVDREYYAAHDRWREQCMKDPTTPYSDEFLHQVQKHKELTDEINGLEEEVRKLDREAR